MKMFERTIDIGIIIEIKKKGKRSELLKEYINLYGGVQRLKEHQQAYPYGFEKH